MPGEINKDEKQELKLDAANQEVLDYANSEEAEADRILAEATGQEPEKESEKKAEEPVKAEGDTKGLPEKKEEPVKAEGKPSEKKKEAEAEPEDFTKDLTTENADKRIKAARTKMMESNKTANAAIAETERVKKENVALQALVDEKMAVVPEQTKEPEKKEEPDELEKSLEALKSEYPEIADPVLKVLHKTREENRVLKERMDGFDAKEVQREEATVKSAEDVHYNSIAEAHPDFEEISAEPLLDQWINELPAIEKAGAQAIRKDGSTSDVIALLTKFKEANGYEVPTKEKEPKVKSKLEKAKEQATPSFKKAKEVNTKSEEVQFTQEQIHNMTEKEWEENEPAIDEALKKGLVV